MATTIAPIVRQRNRGSVVDSVTLESVLFQYEPKPKTKNPTKYAKQGVIGKRLSVQTFMGASEPGVELDITLSAGGANTVDDMIATLKAFGEPQSDTGAPHPVYLNVGDTYIGKLFVLVDMDVQYQVLDYADTMATRDAKVKLKFDEVDA